MRWEADVRLAEHTRYRIGGSTPALGHAGGRVELVEALAGLAGAPYRVLGRGANLLVSDRGVTERVIVLAGEFDALRAGRDHLEAGAAAGLPALVGEARRAAFAGWSFLEAVPGSVGGGLRMNAGSAEVGLWDRVEWAEAITPEGETVRLTPADAGPAYRTVAVPETWIFIGARFAATPGNAGEVEAEHFARRRTKVETQVYDLPSCGSIWKNPGGSSVGAWQLVDRVGMRGARRGDAQIAERHANFIANLGAASAADVWWLMAETRRRVREETGVLLSPEIRLWGFSDEELAAVGAADATASGAGDGGTT